MANNTYVLNTYRGVFNRSNNTTAYPAFTMITNGSCLIMPAPVSDRPFFLRRLLIQALPGFTAANSCTLYVYNADPSGVMTFADGAFINNTAAATANLFEARLSFTIPANTQVGMIDITLNNLVLSCPTGVYALAIDTNVAFTPIANQRYSFLAYTEYGN
jgi:hypothetical protein